MLALSEKLSQTLVILKYKPLDDQKIKISADIKLDPLRRQDQKTQY